MATTAVIDSVTINSLLASLATLILAYFSSGAILPKQSSARSRVLFVWHAFDALTHFFFEGSFLYNIFFTYTQLPGPPSYVSNTHPVLTPPGVFFLGQKTRLYGAFYGNGPTAKLWQEYAKADKRWGGADLTVVSLELLTVFIGGPIAAYVCYLLAQGHGDVQKFVTADRTRSILSGALSFWLIVLATAELYGDFMTFAPEWLTGNPNLDTSNWLYLWLYLVFFNGLWVALPLYSLYHAYASITGATPREDLIKKSS